MTSTQEIGRILVSLQKQINALGSPQLANSSITDSSINEYQAQIAEDGAVVNEQLVSTWGRQYDGTHGIVALAGPTPPTPDPGTATPVPTGLLASWGGTWATTPEDFLAGRPTVAPMDFTQVEVHASTTADFTGMLFTTKRGEITSARGGEVFIPAGPDVPVYVRLVARTTSGKASLASEVSGPFYAGKVAAEQVDIDLSSIGGNQIFWGVDTPVTDKIGDLWLKKPDNAAYRYQGDPDGWVLVRDQGIVEALQEAADAADAASQAAEDALAAYVLGEQAEEAAGAALTVANTAKTTADGKATIYYQTSMPSTGRTNDLWIDSDDSNKTYRYNGTTYVLADDQRIGTTITDLSNLTGTVATKITVFAQISAPSTTGRTTGDIWIDTDDGNRQYTWAGSWTSRQIGSGAVAPNSLIAKDVVATGSVTAALFEAVMVLATTIIAGNPNGNHARMTASGFEVRSPSPLVGAPPYTVVSMGNPLTRDTLGVADQNGNLLANIDEQGVATLSGLYTNSDPTVMGRKLITDWIKERPRGVIARSFGVPDRNGIIGETQLFSCSWPAEAFRHYRITVSGIRFTNVTPNSSSGGTFILRDYSDQQVELGRKYIMNIGGWTPGEMIVELETGIHTRTGHNTILSVAAGGSGLYAQFDGAYPYKMVIEDLGPTKPNTGATYATPSPTPVRTQYTFEAGAIWSQSYRADGQPMSNAAGSLYQGYGDSFNGNSRSLIGFQDLVPMLSGATVDQVLLYLYASHWYNGAGGTAVIGAHGLASQPGTYSGGLVPNIFQSGGWPRAAGRWVDITSIGGNLQNGSYRGIILGPGPSNGTEYYGRFNGTTMSEIPRIRIVYTK